MFLYTRRHVCIIWVLNHVFYYHFKLSSYWLLSRCHYHQVCVAYHKGCVTFIKTLLHGSQKLLAVTYPVGGDDQTCCNLFKLTCSQQTQNICITFVQCWTNVEDVEPTLYKCYTHILCLLGCLLFQLIRCLTSLRQALVSEVEVNIVLFC